MTWWSPVPVVAGRACAEAPGRCCHATTSAPWPSWPTRLATARGLLLLRRDRGPQRVDQLAARLTATGRPIRPAAVAAVLAGDPLLDAVELHGAHDLRHTYATGLVNWTAVQGQVGPHVTDK
jgi:hypothetical protein